MKEVQPVTSVPSCPAEAGLARGLCGARWATLGAGTGLQSGSDSGSWAAELPWGPRSTQPGCPGRGLGHRCCPGLWPLVGATTRCRQWSRSRAGCGDPSCGKVLWHCQICCGRPPPTARPKEQLSLSLPYLLLYGRLMRGIIWLIPARSPRPSHAASPPRAQALCTALQTPFGRLPAGSCPSSHPGCRGERDLPWGHNSPGASAEPRWGAEPTGRAGDPDAPRHAAQPCGKPLARPRARAAHPGTRRPAGLGSSSHTAVLRDVACLCIKAAKVTGKKRKMLFGDLEEVRQGLQLCYQPGQRSRPLLIAVVY